MWGGEGGGLYILKKIENKIDGIESMISRSDWK